MKKALLSFVFLLTALHGHAHPFDHLGNVGNNDELGWLLLFFALFLPLISAPVLAIVSYRRHGRILNIAAWVLAFVSLIYTFAFPSAARGISGLCFVLLINRSLLRGPHGRSFHTHLAISALSMLAFRLLSGAVLSIPYFYLFSLPAIYIANTIYLTWLVYRLMVRFGPSVAAMHDLAQPVLWSIKLGACALLAYYVFESIIMTNFSLILQGGFPLLQLLRQFWSLWFVLDVASWALAGIAAFFYYRRRHMSTIHQPPQ